MVPGSENGIRQSVLVHHSLTFAYVKYSVVTQIIIIVIIIVVYYYQRTHATWFT